MSDLSDSDFWKVVLTLTLSRGNMTLSTVTSALMNIFLTALIMMRTICFMYSLTEIVKRRACRKNTVI